jgi:hypothetical protein
MRMKRLRQMVEDLAGVGREHGWDLIAGGGLLLLAAGLWMMYPPLCLVVLGGTGIGLGLFGAKLTARGSRGTY